MTKDSEPPKELTPDEVIRLCEDAKERGEPTTPIIRRYVLQAIDGVIARLETEKAVNKLRSKAIEDDPW